MENLKKYITGIICCLCAIFLMSDNVGAVTSEAVKFYGSGQSSFTMETNTSGLSCVTNCVWSQNTNGDVVVGVNYLSVALPNGTFQADTIFKLDFILWRVGSSVSDHTVINNLKLTTPAQPFAIYDIDFEQLNANTSMFSIYIKATQNNLVLNDYSVRFYSGLTGSFIFALNPTERVSGGNWSHWAVVDTTVDTQSIVNAINSQTDYTSNLNQINNNINNINNSINNINDEEETATQDAADDASDAADANSTNQQTSNLIGVLQNFLSAITNFSGTDCNITLAFPNYAGGNMSVNVCQNKDKAGNIIGVFTSLTLIVFYLPLALKLLSMIYNEIRSFTNG